MASTLSSGRREEERDPFLVLEPPNNMIKSSLSAKLFDVFINHRGPDVKTTLALQLYNSLQQDGIQAYLDSEETELGDSLSPTIKNAIFSAAVHIAILSPRYAESAWCLAELALMFQTKARIIPLFYSVEPSDFRHIKNGVAEAFSKHEEKGRYPNQDIQQWKECLQNVSGIKGYELKGENDDLNKLCKDIVSAVKKEKERRKIPFQVAKYEVGLDDLVEDFHSHCQRNGQMIDKIIGIFGMGGSGKTTLVKDLFNRKHSEFSGSTSLFDVREKHAKGELTSLQSKILNDLFPGKKHELCSIEDGTAHIKDYLQRSRESRFLVVIDDADDKMQLDAILPIDALNPNSLVIVTTRDERLLIQAGVKVRYKMKKMNAKHSRQLFCWHAFHRESCKSGFENLVDSFVEACGGLPLALQVMGGHVFGSDKGYWKLQLDDVKARLHRDIKHRLKISYDALEEDQKQIFMDIACFFIGEEMDTAISIWKASGWRAEHALETLKDKCLVQVDWCCLRMHDHLRDLGREMADNEMSHPRRLWRPQDLIGKHEIKGMQDILRGSEDFFFRCFNYIWDPEILSKMTYFLKSSKTSTDLQWLKVKNYSSYVYIPAWIPVQNLQTLILEGVLPGSRTDQGFVNFLRELTSLKTLELSFLEIEEIALSNRRETTDYRFRMRSLEAITLRGISTTRKVSISGELCPTLKSLKLYTMEDLNEVDLTGVTTLERLELFQCRELRIVWGNDMLKLEMFRIEKCRKMKELPNFGRVSCLKKIEIRSCWSLQNISAIERLKGLKRILIKYCPNLQNIKATEQLKGLKSIWIEKCPKLQNIVGFKELKELKRITIVDCPNLQDIKATEQLKRLKRIGIGKCPQLQDIIDFKELKELKEIIIADCPKLQNIEGIEFLICLESIMIGACPKLQNIRGIEELKGLKKMIIEDAPLISCVERLQRLPREITTVVGRSAMSDLNADEIGDALTMADAFCEIESGEDVKEMIHSFHKAQQSVSTFIFCGILVGSTDASDNIRVCYGTWICMCVVNEEMLSKYDSWMPSTNDNAIKKAFIMGVKKGSERKTLDILQILFAQLCNKEDQEYDGYSEDEEYHYHKYDYGVPHEDEDEDEDEDNNEDEDDDEDEDEDEDDKDEDKDEDEDEDEDDEDDYPHTDKDKDDDEDEQYDVNPQDYSINDYHKHDDYCEQPDYYHRLLESDGSADYDDKDEKYDDGNDD